MAKTARKTDQPTPPALIAAQVLQLPIDLICPDPNQPRTEFDETKLREFAKDIATRGIEIPIVIRSDYVIKDGERRWRAAKIAGLRTVPCLLAAPLADDASAVDWRLDQVADNHHREPLSALDWGRFFRGLVDQGTSVGEIPELLARRGITMSRPYVSNLMRLTELPAWAQDLISTGKLRPADGKYILMALPHPPAMKELQCDLQEEVKGLEDGERILRFNAWQVRNAYRRSSPMLNEMYGADAPRFHWSTSCKGCDKRQQIEGDHFCLDKNCFEKKQAQADLKKEEKDQKHSRVGEPPAKSRQKPEGPTKVTPNADGVVVLKRLDESKAHFLDDYDIRFLPAMSCAACPHNMPAIRRKGDAPKACCFNIPCFTDKQRNGNRAEGIAQWVDRRVLPALIEKVAASPALQHGILVWMALYTPTHNEHESRVEAHLRTEASRVRQRLKLQTPSSVICGIETPLGNVTTRDEASIAAAGVRAMVADRGNFYALARFAGVTLTPEIASIDDDYLDLKRKPELLDLARLSGMLADGGELAKKKLGEIRGFVASAPVIEAIGVPPDAAALFAGLEPEFDEDYSGEDNDDAADLAADTGGDAGAEEDE